jgi:hypothetical protein
MMRKRSDIKALEEAALREQYRCSAEREVAAQTEYDAYGEELAEWNALDKCSGVCRCQTIEEAVQQHGLGIRKEVHQRYGTRWLPFVAGRKLWVSDERADRALSMAVSRYHRRGWAAREKPYGLYVWLRNNTFSCASSLVRAAAREWKRTERRRQFYEEQLGEHTTKPLGSTTFDWTWVEDGRDNEFCLLVDGYTTDEILQVLHGHTEKVADAEFIRKERRRLDQKRRRMKRRGRSCQWVNDDMTKYDGRTRTCGGRRR